MCPFPRENPFCKELLSFINSKLDIKFGEISIIAGITSNYTYMYELKQRAYFTPSGK